MKERPPRTLIFNTRGGRARSRRTLIVSQRSNWRTMHSNSMSPVQKEVSTEANVILDAAAKTIGHFAAGLGTVAALTDIARVLAEVRGGIEPNAIPSQSSYLRLLKTIDRSLAIVEAGFVFRDIIRDRLGPKANVFSHLSAG